MAEKFPAHEAIKVLEGQTVYKTAKWWKAVLLVEAFGRRQVVVYLWQNKEGTWKRKQKYTIRSRSDWMADAQIIDTLLNKLG